MRLPLFQLAAPGPMATKLAMTVAAMAIDSRR
jgi:hypothetical protein